MPRSGGRTKYLVEGCLQWRHARLGPGSCRGWYGVAASVAMNVITPNSAAIDEAAGRIVAHIRRTPVLRVAGGDFGLPHEVALKLEFLQHAGSFKPRGAFNRILVARELGAMPAQGVIAASGGNHGAAVAYAAGELGLKAEDFCS